MTIQGIIIELRNTTGGTISFGTFSISSGSSGIIWNTVDYIYGSTGNFEEVLSNIAIFNENIGNGNLIMEINDIDQSSSDAFIQFQELRTAFDYTNIKNNFSILKMDAESILGLTGIATTSTIGLMSAADKVKLDSISPTTSTGMLLTATAQGYGVGAFETFLWPEGSARSATYASASIRNIVILNSVTISKLGVKFDYPGSANLVTFKLYKNGVASTLTGSLNADVTTATVLTGTPISFVQGDTLALSITQATGTNASEICVTLG